MFFQIHNLTVRARQDRVAACYSGDPMKPIALLLALLASAGLALALGSVPAAAQPTPEDYVAHVGGGAYIVESGDLKIAGHKMQCGTRPTVLDPNLDDFGAAYDGFMILNPRKLEAVPAPVALWIFSHECGHQFRGPDENKADCFAVQRGRRQGWLTATDVEQICTFISPSQGDMMHFAGPQRCQSIRRCFGSKDLY